MEGSPAFREQDAVCHGPGNIDNAVDLTDDPPSILSSEINIPPEHDPGHGSDGQVVEQADEDLAQSEADHLSEGHYPPSDDHLRSTGAWHQTHSDDTVDVPRGLHYGSVSEHGVGGSRHPTQGLAQTGIEDDQRARNRLSARELSQQAGLVTSRTSIASVGEKIFTDSWPQYSTKRIRR